MKFPGGHPGVTPGFDPIIGQNSNDNGREMEGFNATDQSAALQLGTKEFVGSSGGEYFFVPSMSSLDKNFALAPAMAPKQKP